MRLLGRRLVGTAVLAALLLAVVGCGGDSDDGAAPVAQIDADAPPLSTFDVYAVGSTDGNVLFSDLYGIALNPLRAYRLSADKRVSWITANASAVAVAAADEQVDKLGLVQPGGGIAEIPGLGRPHAYSPEFQPDGTMRYEDLGTGDAIVHRYMSYDPETQKTTVLFKTKDDTASIAAAGPDGGFLSVVQAPNRDDQILVMDFDGKKRAITIAPQIGSPVSGKGFIVSSVYRHGPDVPATDTAVVNPRTGKVRLIEGWAMLGISPDRTRFLAVRHSGGDAELAVVDPANPGQPEILGTIPGLTLFMASWVDRSASAG
jgi:hypothetical protein